MQVKKCAIDKLPIIIISLMATISQPMSVTAQTQQSTSVRLEEIIVTAQRREQNLQDVPVSIQTFRGDEIARQGFHTLNSLTTYAPGLIIKDQGEEQGLLLRSAGTQSKNMAVEPGVPLFVDGVYLGRGSHIRGGLMDIEGVEVLKGPQPVFFGMNAAAGAVLFRTRKPGDTWDGSIAAEVGNFGMKVFEAAIGGPVTETIGIRVAAKQYTLDGWLRDWITNEKFPQRESQTIRGTFVWKPMEQFQATLKMEYQYNDLGPRVHNIVLDRYYQTPNLEQGERVVNIGITSLNVPGFNQRGTQGVGEWTNWGFKYGPTFVNPRVEAQASGIPLTMASTAANGTVFDMTECQKNGGMLVDPGGIPSKMPEKADACDLTDESESEPWQGMLDLDYVFENGIQLNSKTAFSSQKFYNMPGDSGGGAFNHNVRSRGEFYNQWSSELRLVSDTGGKIEWMGGLFYQIHDLDYWSDRFRLNAQRPLLAVRASDDSEWKSAFATVTYNFLDNKASLDVGGRYTDIKKVGNGFNSAAEYYVRNEISDGGDGSVVRVPFGLDVIATGARGVASRAFITANPGIVNGSIVGRSAFTLDCSTLRAASIPGLAVPASSCVRLTNEIINEEAFDPQIVLRYRPSENISLYGKYAKAFKAGSFDLAVSELPTLQEDFAFGPEKYKMFEIGARGTFMDNRLSFEATAYQMDMTGVQVTYVSRVLDRSVTQNIAKQEVKGLELNTKFAATDTLTLSGYLAIMDGVIVEYNDATCTADEIVGGTCRTAADSLALIGTTRLAGTIDRSGVEARNAPDWQFSGNARYELPTIIEGFNASLDTTFMASDAYIPNRNFSKMISMKKHADINLSLLVGPNDEKWNVMFFGRNLLAPKPSYFPELDIAGEGILEGFDAETAITNYANYGVRLTYNFF